ncbi:arsenate reductase family protein [Chryseomicrobium palamuruense]|uniref:Arsenate reductase family protein n=1 Tax=Chryseomicrobium palamuruense TaxID=682973 RepID=A0ABV8UX05_9BACL
MAIDMYGYPKCTTCKKAEKWMKDQGIDYTYHHIVEDPPNRELVKEMAEKHGLELKKLFNTSGQKYRELGLKDKLSNMSHEEKLDVLTSDGMLIKRPFTTDGEKVTVGFKEADFEAVWQK